MKLSVIIPVYNVEKYLDACLGSVFSQERGAEVIAVDDGSTDRSPEILAEWAKKRSGLCVIRQENRGLGGARNTGIRAATGDWLVFLDSDDELTPGALERLEGALASGPDAVIFRFAYEDSHGRPANKRDDWRGVFETENFSDRKDLLLENPNACDKAFRRDLFVSGSVFFPEKVLYEDLRTVPKLLSLCGRVKCIDEKLYVYKERGGSIMNGGDAAKNLQIIPALDDLIDWFGARQKTEELKDEIEMLAIRHLLTAATVRALRADPSSKLPEKFVSYMEEHFKDFRKNRYLRELPRAKRLAVKLAAARRFGTLGALFSLKDRLAKFI